jgi:hypothetical protein
MEKTAGPYSLLEAGLGNGSITARGRIEPKHCGTPGHTAGRRAHRADDSTSDMNPKPLPITDPIGGPPVHLRREVLYSSCRGLWVMGLGPSGKAMTEIVVAAPAPGSLNNTNSIMGAGDGFGCLTSPDKAHAPMGKGVRRFFCDVHRKAKNGEGYRITFTTDGVTFRHVDSFTDIPATAGDTVFVDAIPLQHTDGLVELLRRGVEVYYLRRLTLQKREREEHRFPKTAKGDIKTLMMIDLRWYRKVSEDFLIMRRLISVHRSLLKTHQQLENKRKAVSEDERNVLKPAIKALEEQMDVMAKKIAEEAGRRYPAYKRLVEELDIDGNTTAMEALAEILTYLDPMKGFRKTVNFLGLFKPVRGRKKIYDGRLRQALQRLTSSANNIRSLQLTARMEKEMLAKIWKTYRQETHGRLAISHRDKTRRPV